MADLSGRRYQDQFMLRLPDGMRDILHEAAKSNARSLNAEIVARLDASFTASRSIDSEVSKILSAHIDAQVAKRLTEIARQIGGGDVKA